MTSSAEDAVVILDEVWLPADQVDPWLAHWRRAYLKPALQRGLRLRGVWTGFTGQPDEAVVVISWSMERVGPYWAARWMATEDEDVHEFWQGTDAIARMRERRVLQNRGLET
jgi:hypothetical protein